MKNKFILILILGVVVMITNSCSKSENSETLTATVNGRAFGVNGTSITYNTSVSGNNTNYVFTISFTGFTLYLYLPSIKTGSYNFVTGYNPGPGMLLSGGNNETYTTVKNSIPAHGSIVITASTGSTISGTFSGSLYPEPAPPLVYTDSTIISSGVFTNVQY